MCTRSARIVRRTDGHTHRQTDRHTMSKLLHPPLSRGVKIRKMIKDATEYDPDKRPKVKEMLGWMQEMPEMLKKPQASGGPQVILFLYSLMGA